MRTRLLPIHNNLFIAPCDGSSLGDWQEDSDSDFLIPILKEITAAESEVSQRCLSYNGFLPSSLSAISRFNDMVNNISGTHPHSNLIFCTSNVESYQPRLAFLLGCHLIMAQGLGFEETYLAFRPLDNLISDESGNKITIQIALRAFCCAKCMGWIEFTNDCSECKQGTQMICMDEYEHYAR